MAEYGVIREADPLGRIVIPKEIRTGFGIKPKDAMEIFTEDSSIILKKYNPGCCICENMNIAINFKGKRICTDCLEIIKNQLL